MRIRFVAVGALIQTAAPVGIRSLPGTRRALGKHKGQRDQVAPHHETAPTSPVAAPIVPISLLAAHCGAGGIAWQLCVVERKRVCASAAPWVCRLHEQS
jgi:hypothetical protein